MKYDYKILYQKNADLLTARRGGKKAVLVGNVLLQCFFPAAYLLLFAYVIFGEGFAPNDYLKLFFLPAICLLLTTLTRLCADRPRPYSEQGAGITPLKERKGNSSSFPSIAVAFGAVVSFLFFPYLPAVGVLCALLCLGLAYCQFALGYHYPSDLLAGLALGGAVGCFLFLL